MSFKALLVRISFLKHSAALGFSLSTETKHSNCRESCHCLEDCNKAECSLTAGTTDGGRDITHAGPTVSHGDPPLHLLLLALSTTDMNSSVLCHVLLPVTGLHLGSYLHAGISLFFRKKATS